MGIQVLHKSAVDFHKCGPHAPDGVILKACNYTLPEAATWITSVSTTVKRVEKHTYSTTNGIINVGGTCLSSGKNIYMGIGLSGKYAYANYGLLADSKNTDNGDVYSVRDLVHNIDEGWFSVNGVTVLSGLAPNTDYTLAFPNVRLGTVTASTFIPKQRFYRSSVSGILASGDPFTVSAEFGHIQGEPVAYITYNDEPTEIRSVTEWVYGVDKWEGEYVE